MLNSYLFILKFLITVHLTLFESVFYALLYTYIYFLSPLYTVSANMHLIFLLLNNAITDKGKVITSSSQKGCYYERKMNITNKGKDMFEIKSRVGNWPWATIKDRNIDSAMSRLRIGHMGLSQYLFRFHMAKTPLCECGYVETRNIFFCTVLVINSNEFYWGRKFKNWVTIYQWQLSYCWEVKICQLQYRRK